MDDLDYAALEERIMAHGLQRADSLISQRKEALARGDNTVDVITAEAARFFNVAEDAVTAEQRRRMKQKLFLQLYRTPSPIRKA